MINIFKAIRTRRKVIEEIKQHKLSLTKLNYIETIGLTTEQIDSIYNSMNILNDKINLLKSLL